MTRGVFYCYQIPRANLAEIEWIVEKPIRDRELEAEVGQPVWMVKYDTAHPSMQKMNRFDTCKKWLFGGIVFDDDIEDEADEESQEITLVWCQSPQKTGLTSVVVACHNFWSKIHERVPSLMAFFPKMVRNKFVLYCQTSQEQRAVTSLWQMSEIQR
ncbi:MAG TPA: hypothetical protein V6D50_15950 [Chroococcales cyanobacterium]|jgi:hypothetical protein